MPGFVRELTALTSLCTLGRAFRLRSAQLLEAMESRYTLAAMVVVGNGLPVSKRFLGTGTRMVSLMHMCHALQGLPYL